jgi:hypothetical protein
MNRRDVAGVDAELLQVQCDNERKACGAVVPAFLAERLPDPFRRVAERCLHRPNADEWAR